MKPSSQRGVALVITLIMLAVVTFMATAFLTLSRRERGAVKVSTDESTAQLLAQMAADQAVAQTAARILATSNMLHYDLMVSTNFVNPDGFRSGVSDPRNVSYQRTDGSMITNNNNDIIQNCANLYYSPRVPVFASYTYRNLNNQLVATNEFRFFYDLNRNGLFEPNGYQPVLDNQGRTLGYSNFFVGDPEWIGVLQQPDARHSSSNRFMGRYAFFAVPSGKTLDVNSIHNLSRLNAPNPAPYGSFMRHQGVGPWEENFAAFLCDLNTNLWPRSIAYDYTNTPAPHARGLAFQDAYLLTRARKDYGANWSGYTLGSIYRSAGISDLAQAGIDLLSDGPIAFTPSTREDTNKIWSGADNLYSFTDIQQLLTLTNQNLAFTNLTWGLEGNHPNNRRTRNSSYDRYTFYRMLGQLGVDSQPAWDDKINLNYRNDTGFTVTNLVRWTPIAFFTNTADRLLRAYYGLSITNIQVYPYTNSSYGAGLHRLLQLTANIYDATTTNSGSASIFKPVFTKTSTNVCISGYVYVTPGAAGLSSLVYRPWRDLNYAADRSALQPTDNVHGVPYVIGAKQSKNFLYPNFNEASMQTAIELTRKIELRKPNNMLITRPNATNQMYILGISNVFAVEGWNSHLTNIPGRLLVQLTNQVSIALVQSNRIIWPNTQTPMVRLFGTAPNKATLIGWPSNSFIIHLMTNMVFLTNAVYSSQGGFRPSVPATFEYRVDLLNRTNPVFLMITNRLQYVVIDDTRKVLLDYVTLNNLVNQVNVTDVLTGGNYRQDSTERGLWDGDTGITNQIEISLGNIDSPNSVWRSYTQDPAAGDEKDKAIDRFRMFVGLTPIRYGNGGKLTQLQREVTASPLMQTPFNPTRKFVSTISLQVNDPLVHYTVEDLLGGHATNQNRVLKPPTSAMPAMNVGLLNERYRPWGGNPQKDNVNDTNAFNIAIKDPLIHKSDDWNFPNQLFPNVGWLGRVHRGTPWQTVYFKSPVASVQNWTTQWAGRPDTHPTNDWRLVDIFTTALYDNAAKGMLSVNQTNLAAWSAVLSGVSVSTNAATNDNQVLILPASHELTMIVTNMNAERALWPGQEFPYAGAILSTPALTAASPYISLAQGMPRDEVVERIPQQVLSLLKADEPRLTIYALGQSLRPAQNSLVLEPGPNFRLCTNYEVTAEIATKTVLRFEGPPTHPRVVKESFRILPIE
jgi:hypothetical protein